jgi:hypothetical protein
MATVKGRSLMNTSLRLSYNRRGRLARRCTRFLSMDGKDLTCGDPAYFSYHEDQIRADNFLNRLMQVEFEGIPGPSQLKVLRGMVNLETGQPNVDVIVRGITTKFWRSCIEVVDTPGWRFRVAAVGTSGIGKTVTTPILIRLLLEAGHTVVYLVRADGNQGWFYEFSGGAGGPFSARVYPERTNKNRIPSLQLKTTYFVVDPGDTTDSSDPPSDFSPKIILVSSPDSSHWGDNEFQKLRVKVAGFFKVYPIWTLDELVDAQPIICPEINKDDVLRRFRLFGGIPEYVFEDDEEDLLERQNRDVKSLGKHDVEEIALGHVYAVGSYISLEQKRMIVGFELAPDDNGMFENEVGVVMSPAVQEKMYSRFIVKLWYLVLSGKGNASCIFESYVRKLFTGYSGTSMFLPVRNRLDDEGRDTFFYHPFPRCQNVQTVVDLFSTIFSADTESLVLYHTSRSDRELFNLAYKDVSTNSVYLIRTSIEDALDSNARHVEEFLEQMDMVDVTWHLYVLYPVPSEKFPTFKTIPRNPFQSLDHRRVEKVGTRVEMMHVAIPNPTLKKRALEDQLRGSSCAQAPSFRSKY